MKPMSLVYPAASMLISGRAGPGCELGRASYAEVRTKPQSTEEVSVAVR